MPIGIITTYESGVDLVFEWKIQNFLTLAKIDGIWYESPTLSFGGVRWYLRIYPNGFSESGTPGHVDLHLCKYISDRAVNHSFSLSLKTVKGKKYKERHCMKYFPKGFGYHESLGFIPRSELTRRSSEIVPEGFLTVVYTMKNTTSARNNSSLAVVVVKPSESSSRKVPGKF